ncbi:MAG: hypothetical protein KC931_05630 [Candidatus Omnitrophica bacterium]|nr:hypothetical protein [Candidatus Omnitrophota bacterium]MCA9427051.1 hypothetical protein [Candidatus Omnitrophota bacterium]MCA9446574.1 hypothetical protein [Candidatus Omnitrophota bacterium]
MSFIFHAEKPGGETGRDPRPVRVPRLMPILVASVIVLTVLILGGADACYGQGRGYTKKITPTPTPRPDRATMRLQEVEEVYRGYAKLFVLGHIFNQATGVRINMPRTIDLDYFAQQPLLAEGTNIYVFPRGKRDPLWPLVLPTPQEEQVAQLPTETPTPPPAAPESTPTPTPSPTPTEVVPPPLSLQIVSLSQNGPLVMISDTILGVGDTVDNATITEIDRHYATIQYYGKSFYVTKKGTVRPEDFSEEEVLFFE